MLSVSLTQKVSLFQGEHAKKGDLFRGQERWWTVSFIGEHLSDAGGGFRETVSNLSDDLNSDRTDLMIPTPNHVHEAGNLRNAWMPNPGCVDFAQFEFVGRLMAGAIQTQENIVVAWPPFVWQLLAGYSPTEQEYAASIDLSVATYADIGSCSADEFELQYEDIFSFEITRSDGVVHDLLPAAETPSGGDVAVTFENRHDFIAAAVEARLGEIVSLRLRWFRFRWI